MFGHCEREYNYLRELPEPRFSGYRNCTIWPRKRDETSLGRRLVPILFFFNKKNGDLLPNLGVEQCLPPASINQTLDHVSQVTISGIKEHLELIRFQRRRPTSRARAS